jgi:cobalt-precorrin-5B (C1)-methyltransferase
MSTFPSHEIDMTVPAENGLKRGWTTGSCATAGVKAAMILLENGERFEQVAITLPDQEHFLVMPIHDLDRISDRVVRATVIKNVSDDPDATRGAKIISTINRNNSGRIRFLAGPGVGTVTQPGIRVPVGEPAINPGPRQMILQAIDEVLDGRSNPGYDLTIACENGEAIAKRTFNPRLGIAGGISILGTTGIVEPMSLAAYKASIEVYVRVALADSRDSIAYMPGNIGLAFAKNKLGLDAKHIVQVANFLGFALDCAQTALIEENRTVETLWVLGHPGKLAKVLDQAWDTHSKNSSMAMPAIARVAADLSMNETVVKEIAYANTVEAAIESLSQYPERHRLWQEMEERLGALMSKRVPRAVRVEVRLFSMNGTPLGRCT